MLYAVLKAYIRFPLLGYILNTVYYTMIGAGVTTGAVLIYKQLARAGYDRFRLRAFFLLCLILVPPLGFISSRAANMFYYPPGTWSFSFFWEQLFSGPHQTYHAVLVLPLLAVIMLAFAFKINRVHVLDTLFLYLPLGHAISRGGCLLAGCCYGFPVHVCIAGHEWSFHNPVPLYAIILNLLIFLFLRRIYRRLYPDASGKNFRGAVMAGYLICYGVSRFILETVRTEKVVGLGMTQAQWSMIFFCFAGLLILTFIFVKNHVRKTI